MWVGAEHCDVVADLADVLDSISTRQWIGVEVASRLARQGFCTLGLDLEERLLQDAQRDAQGLEACGRFSVPPEEVARGLLGVEGSTEICEFDSSQESSEPSGLRAADRILSALGEALEPQHLEPLLGFFTESRSQTLLHVARGKPDTPGKLTEAECSHWLDIFVRQRLMCLLFLGPQKGTLELQPSREEAEPLELGVEPGSLVIVRSDLLSRSFHASSGAGACIVMSCFFSLRSFAGPITEDTIAPEAWVLLQWCKQRLSVLKAQVEDDTPGTTERPEIPRNWQLAMNHLFSSSQHKQVSIKSMACHFPTTMDPLSFWAGLGAGGDFATDVPVRRFDWTLLYDPAPDGYRELKSYAMHGVFVDGADLFDNRFFAISPVEAASMDPTQYMLMQVGYEALNKAGHRKKDLMQAQIGVYVGQGVVEMPPKDLSASMGGTGAARAVACGRISFSLGLQGPCCALDAHAASAFACMEVGFQSLQHQARSFKTALAGCVMLTFNPYVYVEACAARDLSPLGRCCTFDSSARGYVKSEGCSFAVLKGQEDAVDGQALQDDGAHDGVFCALHISSLGRAATLGAPNASVEQAVIAEALRSAELAPLNVDFVECVGSGHLLSDEIEASYLPRCLRYEEPGKRPLQLGAVMSQVGFMRETAGFAQLVKVLEALSFGVLAANQHLRQISPHMDEGALESLHLATEVVPCQLATNFAGITSRGLGGVFTHAIVGVQVQECQPLPHVVPSKAAAPQEDIVFWPAGGGALDDAAEPSVGFFIAGSWSNWAEVEPMVEESPNVFALSVAFAEGGLSGGEAFQIWIDADPQRALHPAWQGAASGAPLSGPSGEGDYGHDFCWEVLPEVEELAEGEATGGRASSAAQRRCHIRLRSAGRWRVVDWEWEAD